MTRESHDRPHPLISIRVQLQAHGLAGDWVRNDGLKERQAGPSEFLLHDDAQALTVEPDLPAGQVCAAFPGEQAQLGSRHTAIV